MIYSQFSLTDSCNISIVVSGKSLFLCHVCSLPDLHRKRNSVKEQVTDNMLKAVIDVYISETDSISLLDIPSTFVSVDADNAEAIM